MGKLAAVQAGAVRGRRPCDEARLQFGWARRELAAAPPPLALTALCHLQSFSYMCTDVSVSRLLGELQRLTSLQQLDVLSPFTGAGGQGLVVWARELVQ